MKLTQENALTVAAVAFAGFAVWFMARGPGKALFAGNTGQATGQAVDIAAPSAWYTGGAYERQAGIQQFFEGLRKQEAQTTALAPGLYADQLARIGVM